MICLNFMFHLLVFQPLHRTLHLSILVTDGLVCTQHKHTHRHTHTCTHTQSEKRQQRREMTVWKGEGSNNLSHTQTDTQTHTHAQINTTAWLAVVCLWKRTGGTLRGFLFCLFVSLQHCPIFLGYLHESATWCLIAPSGFHRGRHTIPKVSGVFGQLLRSVLPLLLRHTHLTDRVSPGHLKTGALPGHLLKEGGENGLLPRFC